MDPHPKLPPEGSLPVGIDLDRTDELPALDLRAHEAAAHDRLAETWVQPGPVLATADAEPRAAAGSAEDPMQTAVANLREAQELLASRAARLAEIERALEEAQGARAGAERHAEQLASELTVARAAAALRESELGEELKRARAAAGQQVSDLAEELAAARRVAGQREAQLAGELSEERAAGQLRLAAALEATEQQRTRAATYFESLQSTERRRALLEGLLSELHDEIDAHQSGHDHLTRELAGRDMRAGELESDLSDRAVRITDLDSQVAKLATALRERDVELARLRAVEASLSSALEAARASGNAATARVAEHESALNEARTRGTTLEAELAAERRSGAGRDEELARVRAEAEEWAGALRTAQLEHGGHLASRVAGEARVKELEGQVAEQADSVRRLHSVADAAVARTHELEGDLRAAEEGIARLESQLRGRDARVTELERANQQWRHTLDESHAAHGATDTPQALRQAPRTEAGDGAAASASPEGATRLLIRSDGGREVVHVLGRKTTIGRTPENDLQIDVKYISRHHAVILAGPAHTIIEDLNSTNGVMVNGKRITRQTLNDGDLVTIARAEYRFALRRSGEKR